jgi:2-haloalkanoic acid dehalogenase type II
MKGIFFDLGGTLYSYRNVPRATAPLLIEAVERLGLMTEFEDVKRAYNRAAIDTTAAYARKPYYLHRDFFRDTFMRFAELVGGEPDDSVHAWYHEAHRTAIIDCLVLKEDCIDTLSHLKEQGLYLSIVSNIDDEMLQPLVAREGLDGFFDHWMSSETARSCKPDRRFFDVALDKSGLDPGSVLFVGDSPEHDVIGAKAAGMKAALIIDGGMEPPLQTGRDTVTPDHTIHNLSELKEILAKR